MFGFGHANGNPSREESEKVEEKYFNALCMQTQRGTQLGN